MKHAFVAGFARTPFTAARKGALAGERPDELGAVVVDALLERSGVPGDEIEDVIFGCAFPEGEQGLNIGRVIALLSRLPETVPGATVNRWCGSSVQAIQMAAGMIATGAGEAFIAGGVDCASRVPMMGFNPSPSPRWSEHAVLDYVNMGLTAERVAEQFSVSRRDQEELALRSQANARRAQAEGLLSAEIVPVHGAGGEVDRDGCIRDTSLDLLADLKPVFKEGGTVTAGTSSPLTDGASAVLICSEDFLSRHDLQPLARISAFAVSGCAPGLMGIGPIEACRKAVARAGIAISDIDVVEFNEAFASQVEACRRELGFSADKMNIDGGAIALGHPFGATGARLVGKAAQLLHREKLRYGLASQCIGGGMGIAMILEAA